LFDGFVPRCVGRHRARQRAAGRPDHNAPSVPSAGWCKNVEGRPKTADDLCQHRVPPTRYRNSQNGIATGKRVVASGMRLYVRTFPPTSRSRRDGVLKWSERQHQCPIARRRRSVQESKTTHQSHGVEKIGRFCCGIPVRNDVRDLPEPTCRYRKSEASRGPMC
jgi:hypothetical protein